MTDDPRALSNADLITALENSSLALNATVLSMGDRYPAALKRHNALRRELDYRLNNEPPRCVVLRVKWPDGQTWGENRAALAAAVAQVGLAPGYRPTYYPYTGVEYFHLNTPGYGPEFTAWLEKVRADTPATITVTREGS